MTEYSTLKELTEAKIKTINEFPLTAARLNVELSTAQRAMLEGQLFQLKETLKVIGDFEENID